MKKILKQRQIDTLYHFTQVKNLSNILKYGLLPRSVLEKKSINSYFNDDYRYDNCTDAVCMSIEFPNYRMFYKYRRQNPNVDWVVLNLDIQILLDFPCAYCWTNAGSEAEYSIPIEEKMNKNAFLELFDDQPGFPKREKLNIGDWYPTNPQAEVLVFGTIPSEYIKDIYFESRQVLNENREKIPNRIKAKTNTNVFSYREDWEFWKN